MKHGEEGTHSVCDNRLIAEQGNASCCVCVPHDNCSLEAQNSPSQSNQDPNSSKNSNSSHQDNVNLSDSRPLNQDRDIFFVMPGIGQVPSFPIAITQDQYAGLLAWRDAHTEQATSKVDRFEVIDETGRAYVRGSIYGSPVSVELSYQDDGKTLKVFVKKQLDKGE